MSVNEKQLKRCLAQAVSRTLESMAFEQGELIEGSLEQYLADKEKNLNSLLSSQAVETADSSDKCDLDPNEEAYPPGDSSGEADGVSEIEMPLTAGIIEEELWTSISILKPLRGEMILIFPSLYAGKLTEAIYGGLSDTDSNEVTVNDAVAEVINIIAGCFIQELIPSNKRFELGLPNTGWGEVPPAEAKALELNFDIGGHILTAIVGGEDFQNYVRENDKIQEKVS